MDIDEFLDKELQVEKKEETEETVAIQISKEDEGTIRHYFELWDKLSEAKLRWDGNLHEELIKTGNELKGELNRLLSVVEREKNTIKHLIDKAINELDKKNYENATKIYSEITDMLNNFPDFFVEEKKALNREIFQIYEKLKDKIDSKFIEDSNRSISKVYGLIRDSFSKFKAGGIEESKKIYEDALKSYKELPHGFLPQKIDLGNGLLALYKDLSIYVQIKDLQQNLGRDLGGSFNFIDKADNLKILSEIIRNRVGPPEKTPIFTTLKTISDSDVHHMPNKTLLPKLVNRKLERAKINLNRGLYLEAKRNLESVLSVDPQNAEAKQMLGSMPAGY